MHKFSADVYLAIFIRVNCVLSGYKNTLIDTQIDRENPDMSMGTPKLLNTQQLDI